MRAQLGLCARAAGGVERGRHLDERGPAELHLVVVEQVHPGQLHTPPATVKHALQPHTTAAQTLTTAFKFIRKVKC